jgi:hypothetical protein
MSSLKSLIAFTMSSPHIRQAANNISTCVLTPFGNTFLQTKQ